MKTEIRKTIGYFNATGSEILPNGCIKFTYFMGTPPSFAECNPEHVVSAVIKNKDETGNVLKSLYARRIYIEHVNGWLAHIGRSDLLIPLLYTIETITIIKKMHYCSCGYAWEVRDNKSDNTNGVDYSSDPNFLQEYTESHNVYTEFHDTCSRCETDKKIESLINSVDGLSNEVRSRQISAVQFFDEHPDFNPFEYEVVHRSTGFNPEINGRNGTAIGSTRNGKRSSYVCYLIKKSA